MSETGRPPNLEGMDEQEVARFLTEGVTKMSAAEEYESRHEDYVMEMPQSGERIRGRQNMREFQQAYAGHSTPPTIRLRRVIVRENLWVAEWVADCGGGQVFHGAAIQELRDGKIWCDTSYYAEPFEAPAWRSQWAGRTEPEEMGAAPDGATGGRPTEEDEIRRLVDLQFAKMGAGDYAGAHEWYDEAVVVEWPRSGERIRGKENLLALRQAYPAGVEFDVRRVISRRDLAVSEYVIRYDGRPVYVLAVAEFVDGRVAKETHYFAESFEAPEWRARWVEKTEAG